MPAATVLPNLEALQERLGVRFRDPALLRHALVHTSYVHEHGLDRTQANERLEFLGDSILAFVTAKLLFARFPTALEGTLTTYRAALVCTDSLASIARKLGLGSALMLGRGERQAGGHRRSMLAAAFEAVVAAIFLDQGLAATEAFLEPLLTTALEHTLAGRIEENYKARLQEICQARLKQTPRYRVVGQSGPDHAREYVVQVSVSDQPAACGSGTSKQRAGQAAARLALEGLFGVPETHALSPGP